MRPLGIFCFNCVVPLITQPFVREQDGTIKPVGQTAVTAADHHGTNHELAECGELAGERGVYIRMTEGEADIATMREGFSFCLNVRGAQNIVCTKAGDGGTYYAEVTSKKTGKTANA